MVEHGVDPFRFSGGSGEHPGQVFGGHAVGDGVGEPAGPDVDLVVTPSQDGIVVILLRIVLRQPFEPFRFGRGIAVEEDVGDDRADTRSGLVTLETMTAGLGVMLGEELFTFLFDHSGCPAGVESASVQVGHADAYRWNIGRAPCGPQDHQMGLVMPEAAFGAPAPS